MELLKKLLRRQAFNPNWIGLIVNPFYFARKGLYANISSLSHFIKGNILDVGCGQKPYKNLFRYNTYVGMDIENPGHSHVNEDIDIFYDGKNFPLENESFDNALCNQVIEHVFTPDQMMKEIFRVLKPEGKILLTVPFVWDEHEQPNDYARYSSFGIKHLLEKNGFIVEKSLKSINNLSAIFQLFNAYVFKKFMTGSKLGRYTAMLFLVFPTNILGLIFGKIFPSNNDLYLDNVILASKPANSGKTIQ